nr:unnamed protein product [Callosobruchus chinensis]
MLGMLQQKKQSMKFMEHIKDSHMLFITAGMGGGTGTGAAPVIAKAAREARAAVKDRAPKEKKILTIGVVTKPFGFEGVRRMRIAELGFEELQKYVDTFIVIPNQNLFRIANEKTTFSDAFKLADNILHIGIRGVTDLVVMPGLINLDFADIETVMSEMGKAMIDTGEAEGEDRAISAAKAAISNPLLDNVSMKGAQGILINITGGGDMTLFEVDAAANRVREEVDENANIIFGATFDQAIVRVSVLATGIDGRNNKSETSPISQSEDSEKEKFKWPYSHSKSTQDKTLETKPTEQVSEGAKWGSNVYDIPAYLRRKK